MAAKKIYLISFIILLILCSGIKNSFATHISQPVLIDPKTHYTIGDTMILKGWVEYNAQPAPDVLLNFKLIHTDGSIVVDQSYPSDQKGHFEFKFDTKNDPPGTYQFNVTSHCLEIHRYACTYKNQTLSIQLSNP
ncbi:hypothetical protein [Nitrosomonas ureae]|uniref:Uncharacterized protein n=1 Tax=Nitrosomonas ureae TaxID=44577 RepID=A0A1H5X0W4_9PROT|nr:hypothetical protein [Nitrosomonas ureae]SEG05411.1 hypothetical protein SAMN05216334_12315 [Nitrosomonas ureae]